MQKQMLAVIKEKAGQGITVKKIPIPKPKKGEVLVKVIYGSICGTDIGIYDWTPWVAGHLKPPIVIGHEVLGKVIEINDSSVIAIPTPRREKQSQGHKNEIATSPSAPRNDIRVGDLVSSETHIFCGTCYQCKIGNYHVCENVAFYGYGGNGGFAEYATVNIRTTWKNDLRISKEAMVVQEPLGNSVHVITKAHVSGKRVLIVGLGATGLCAAAVAVAYGAREVVAIDPNEYRRNLMQKFEKNVTVQVTLNKDEYNYFVAVCEMSGVAAGFQTCLDAVRIAGKIVVLGIPKQPVPVDVGQYIINKELSIQGIFGRRIWETWYQTQELLTSGKIDLTKLITHTFPLAKFEEAMAIMKKGECGKILLKIG